jgi:hypothetical protein
MITDGQIDNSSVTACDNKLKDYQFTKTICYIIESSSYSILNMSVTCAFTRNC